MFTPGIVRESRKSLSSVSRPKESMEIQSLHIGKTFSEMPSPFLIPGRKLVLSKVANLNTLSRLTPV